MARIAPDVYELTATRLEEVSHQCRPASESFVNPGKSLALDVLGTLPVLWGTSVLSGVAAHRFASQLSENAKYPAMTGVLPEAVYRQIATFDGPFTPSDRSSAPAAEVVEEPRLPAAGDELTGIPDLSSWEYEDPQSPAARGFTPLRLVLIADPEEDQRTAARRARSPSWPTSAASGFLSWPWTASIRWCGWRASFSWPTTPACTWPSPPVSTRARARRPPTCRPESSNSGAGFVA